MSKIMTCPHCQQDVTQKDIDNFRDRQTKARLSKEFVSSDIYQTGSFDDKHRKAMFLLLVCILFSVAGIIGGVYWLNAGKYVMGILSVIGTVSLIIFFFRTSIRKLDAIWEEKRALFEKFKLNRPAAR